MIWIGLAIVVVVALAVLLWPESHDYSRTGSWEDDRSREMLANPQRKVGALTTEEQAVGQRAGETMGEYHERRAVDAMDPQPIESVERLSSGRTPGGTVVDGGPPPRVEAVAHQVTAGKPPTPRPRKPRATSQTVLEVVQRIGPATAKEVAAQLRDTTPAKVSSILVGLRTDRKVTSETRRNLKVWSVLS